MRKNGHQWNKMICTQRIICHHFSILHFIASLNYALDSLRYPIKIHVRYGLQKTVERLVSHHLCDKPFLIFRTTVYFKTGGFVTSKRKNIKINFNIIVSGFFPKSFSKQLSFVIRTGTEGGWNNQEIIQIKYPSYLPISMIKAYSSKVE